MAGKVLFYRYGPAIESLLVEFYSANRPFVIFEENMTLARSLRDRGYRVVFGNLAEDHSVLARVKQARAVVSNVGDHANATCTLLIRECGFFGPLMAEFRVGTGSTLAGKRLGDLQLRERHGVSVIGQWLGGVFTTTKGPDTQVESGAILVVVGIKSNWAEVERMAMPIRWAGPIVVAGYGAIGQKVVELLLDAGEICIVIDRVAAPGVDVVGSVLDQSSLDKAHVREASSVVLALSDDSESVFATAMVRDFAPEVPLIVRVLRTPNTARLYSSGADFAISVGQVAGQILAYHLLGEQTIHVENRGKFIRLNAANLVGEHP